MLILFPFNELGTWDLGKFLLKIRQQVSRGAVIRNWGMQIAFADMKDTKSMHARISNPESRLLLTLWPRRSHLTFLRVGPLNGKLEVTWTPYKHALSIKGHNGSERSLQAVSPDGSLGGLGLSITQRTYNSYIGWLDRLSLNNFCRGSSWLLHFCITKYSIAPKVWYSQ